MGEPPERISTAEMLRAALIALFKQTTLSAKMWRGQGAPTPAHRRAESESPDSIDMEVFVIHDICNEGLDAGLGTPSPKYVAEFKRRAVELCSALIPLRSAGYSFENKV